MAIAAIIRALARAKDSGIEEVRTFSFIPDRQIAAQKITAGGIAIDYFLTVSELASLAESLMNDALKF
jgi:hypothetical protein